MRTVTDKHTYIKHGQYLMRIFTIIDIMSQWRLPKELRDIVDAVSDRLGTRYSNATIHRDLTVLHQLGLMHRTTEFKYKWKLKLDRTSQLQRCAIEILSEQAV